MLLIANSKCHQQLDKILINPHYTGNQQVVCKKTLSETLAFIGKLMLYEMRALQQAYAAQTGLH